MTSAKKGDAANLTTNSTLGGADTCSKGFVNCFLRVPQAVGLYGSCHAAQASKGNFKNDKPPKSVDVADKEGVKKSQNVVDVINGSPLISNMYRYRRDEG